MPAARLGPEISTKQVEWATAGCEVPGGAEMEERPVNGHR